MPVPEYTFKAFITNPLLLSAFIAWCVAQIAKTIIYYLINHEFNWERITGAGGMPSSHSATVCALCTAAACTYGFNSAVFPVTFILAFIVMYDAMGVRWETGEQAKVINAMVKQFQHFDKVFTDQKELKEFVGHTPLQVLMGLIVGIVVALIVCNAIL